MTYGFDNYTNTGILGTLKLTKNWELQLGISAGTETLPWNGAHISLINPVTGYPGYQGARDPGMQPSLTACVQWESDTAWDNIYVCADGINNGDWGFNYVQWLGFSYFHKFNDQWYLAMESYFLYGRNVPDVSQGYANTAFAYVPYNKPNEAFPSVPMMMRQRPAGSLPLRYYGACGEGEASSTLPNNRWSAPCLM